MYNVAQLPLRGNSEPVSGRFNALSDLGFSLIPLLGKAPALTQWGSFREARADDTQLEAWEAAGFNVGIVTGNLSGVVVVDIDAPAAQDWYDAQGFPATPCVATGKGRHYYYLNPKGVSLANRVRVAGLPVDIRAEGGYVVGVGSIHPDTQARYTWIVSPDNHPFASMPQALIDLVAKSVPARTASFEPQKSLPDAPRWFTELLRLSVGELAKAKEGGRNALLNAKAYALARRIAAAGVPWEAVSALLADAAAVAGLDAGEAQGTIASGYSAGVADPIERPAWTEVAESWDAIAKLSGFRHRATGEVLSGRDFDTLHAAAMAETGRKGSLSRYLTSSGLIANYASLDFDPEQPPGAIVRQGLRNLNIYAPPPADAAPGDVSRFQFLMGHLFSEPADRDHVIKWLAHLVQYPGVKISHALLIRSEAHGVGKGTLTDLARALVGDSNSIAISGDRLADKFNGWHAGKLLVIADETSEAGGWQFSNHLKRLITESEITIESKGRDALSLPNRANYMITTNRAAVLKLEAADRRYYVVDSAAQPLPADHFTRQRGWWRTILPAIRHYLLHDVDLSNWLPTAPPPVTAAKTAMVAASRSDLEVEIERLSEARAGAFAGDLATLDDVRASLPDRFRSVTTANVSRAMQALGMEPVGGQTRVGGSWRFTAGHRVWKDGETRVRLWRVRHVAYWEGAPASSLAREYARQASTMLDLLDATHCDALRVWTPDLGRSPNECMFPVTP